MSPKENSAENTALILRLPYWAVGLILMAVIEAVSFALDNFQVTGKTLHDYDTLTRLAYLRESLQLHDLRHGFFDRINAPYGMTLHWTLPFNLFMLGLVKLFSLIDPATALHYAGYWAGTVLRVFVGPAAYWAGRAILKPKSACVASLLVLFSPYLLVYGHRGSANHHALMYLESVVMLGLSFRLARKHNDSPLPGGVAGEGIEFSPLTLTLSPREREYRILLPLLAGAMAGLCLWTTFELAIIVAPLFAMLFYLWVEEGPGRLRALVLAAASFAIVTTAALLVDPPYGGFATPVLDHISMALQSIASGTLLIALGAAFLKLEQRVSRARYFVASSILGIGLWLLCYPFALHGVQGAMDPYVTREWLSQIEEVLPVENWRKAIAFLGIDYIALVLVFTWRAPPSRKEAILAAILLLYILGQLHFRFVLYGAVALPYFLAYAYERASLNEGEFPPSYTKYAAPCALGLIAIFVAIQISITIIHYDVISPPVKDDPPDAITCNPYTVKDALNNVGWLGKSDPIILNEVNHAADLLYWTNVRTVAGNYHRDSQGIKDDYTFFRDMGDKTAKDIVKKRGVDFVLLCGNGNNTAFAFQSIANAAKELAKPGDEFTPEETLYTRLGDEQPPPWLKLRDWPDDTDTDLLLYQVDKAKLGK